MPNLKTRILRGARRMVGVGDRREAAEWGMEAALARAAISRPIGGIVDVGASNGVWSRIARRHWPDAKFLLIEAQRAHEEQLGASGFAYVIAAAGDKPGEIHFDCADLFGGAASYRQTGPADMIVHMTTIDVEVARARIPSPYLIKLDTHGFEREILVGALETLKSTNLLVIEAYNFELMPGAMQFHELCAFLVERGFRVLDLADPMHRPKDNILWQMDLVFSRSSDPGFADSSY